MNRSEFVIMEHKANRAGLHYDLRFKMPKSNMWDSYAVRKGVPTEPGKKVLAVKTTLHTRKEALLTGNIKDGYGAGNLKKWDGGSCDIIVYSNNHIAINFHGNKINGLYHFINTVKAGDKDNKSYFLFKSKHINEMCGMISRIPNSGIAEDTEEGSSEYISKKKLSWSK